jgi:hypothetical protein
LVAQAGEQWGYTPSKAKGPPPSDEEKNVTRAIQLTNGLERWALVQRLWRLRRVRQRLRAQCMVRDVLAHPERRGWGHKFLPGTFGSSGVWYFVRDGQYVRDRREMSEMFLKTFGDIFKDEADDHSTDWVWGEFSAAEIPSISIDLLQRVVRNMKPGKTCARDMVVAEMMKHLPPIAFRKLAELFHCILRHVSTTQEAVVDDWLQVETILLKKLQLVKSPNELRGISILATLRKVLSATCILLAEKKTFFPHRTAQYAFTPGRNSLQVLLAIKL